MYILFNIFLFFAMISLNTFLNFRSLFLDSFYIFIILKSMSRLHIRFFLLNLLHLLLINFLFFFPLPILLIFKKLVKFWHSFIIFHIIKRWFIKRNFLLFNWISLIDLIIIRYFDWVIWFILIILNIFLNYTLHAFFLHLFCIILVAF